MPRPADPSLPFRILAAAYALWSKGGEAAVTIRDVAKKARTTTPSVYAQFADRDAILRGVRSLARGRFEAAMAKSTSVPDGCARVLDFVETYPRDYELLFGYGYRERADTNMQAAEFAGFEVHIRKSGVREADVRSTALAIASLLHGAAMFRLAQQRPDAWWPDFRQAALDGCAELMAARRSTTAKRGSR